MLRGVAGERYEGALEQRTRDGGGAAFVRAGHGEAALRDGGRCVGQWRDGALHGDATCHYANGDVYVGAWDAGRRCGRGSLHGANADEYEGQWRDDQRWGEGTQRHGESADPNPNPNPNPP